MSGSAEIVEYLARRLVDEPDEVRVEEVEREGDLVIELYVAKDDVGKVIGRQGRIAPRPAHGRPRVRRAPQRADAARDHGVRHRFDADFRGRLPRSSV